MGVLIGSVGVFYADSLPSHSMRMNYSHDLDLHLFATAAVVPEVGIGFGGLRVGSDFLLYDGGGYGVLCLLVGLGEGVDGRLVTIHP